MQAIKNIMRKLTLLGSDEQGTATVEWGLLLAAFGIPIILVFRLLLATLIGHYQLATCIITLPFP